VRGRAMLGARDAAAAGGDEPWNSTRTFGRQRGRTGRKGRRGAAAPEGGLKQRLFIALALMPNPQLVLLDELTTGLDPQARHAIWDLVRDVRAKGKTVLLTTHFMEEAKRLGDRVAILDHGRIVALDTPADLIRGLEAEERVVFNLGGTLPAGFEKAAMLDALNMRAFNLTTLSGFYGVMFIYFGLLGAIAAAMWGSDMISKEERDKTVEFSLVLPVSRSRVVTAKALAALVNCVAFVLITWGVSLVAVRQYNPDRAFYDLLALEMQAMFLIELIFLALGLLLGCAMKQYKRSASTAVGIILATYLMSILSVMQERLDFLKYLTPFRYYDAGELFRNGKMDGTYLLLSAAIIVVCVVGAYWAYGRRDLYI